MSKIIDTIKNLKNLKQQTKLIIIFAAEFIAIILILLLIFFAGKKSYTVTFDLNGGTLIDGSVEQRVTQGQSAYPPTVAKYGHYLRGWRGSYKSVTRDIVVKAIWEYETTFGIDYDFPENSNYCMIKSAFKEIQGEVYIGSFYNERQVLGIQAGAFKDRTGVTGIYMLDGILAIEEEAFAGCTSLEVVDIPSTVVRIGKGAFRDCENLKEIILPESLKIIEEGAFEGCTSLERVVFNEKLEVIGDYSFKGCTSLSKVEFFVEKEKEDSKTGLGNNKTETTLPEENKAKIYNKIIGKGAFGGCTSLVEIIIPKDIIEIAKGAFDTPNMTIKLYISEEEGLPNGYVQGWCPADAKFIFGYLPEPETEEEKDKDNGFWG